MESSISKDVMEKVLSELENGSGSSLYEVLIMLRTTLIKSQPSLTQLVEAGCVPLMLCLLEQTDRHRANTKILDIVMSIVGNMCLEDIVRDQVMRTDGIKIIAGVTLASNETSIHNRGTRALANLATDESIIEEMHQLGVPKFVADQLLVTQEEQCQSTYIRALRLFGQTSKRIKQLVKQTQAVQAIAGLIKNSNHKLVVKSVRTLADFCTLWCCPAFVAQFVEANVQEQLLQLVKGEDQDKDLCVYSLSLILGLCEHEMARLALGSAGMIPLFVELFRKTDTDTHHVNKVSVLNVLCLCSKEAVNRQRIGDSRGLELFVDALRGGPNNNLSVGEFAQLYDRIISSLVNFVYHDESLNTLIDMGLVKVLLSQLHRCSHFLVPEATLGLEVVELSQYLVGHFDEKTKKDLIVKDSKNENLGTSDQAMTPSHSVFSVEPSSAHGATNISVIMNPHAESGTVSVEIETVHSNEKDQTTDMEKVDTAEDCQTEGAEPEIDPLIIDPDKEKVDIAEECLTEEVGNEIDPLVIDPDRVGAPNLAEEGEVGRFNINSPSYLAESSWRAEDFTSGVTCKTSFEPSPAPYYEGNFSPYSPLSSNVSYYSPTRSSQACSQTLSPPHSPSSRNIFSPGRSLSSPAPSSPLSDSWGLGGGYSPNSPASQSLGPYSPLSYVQPASPPLSTSEITQTGLVHSPASMAGQVDNGDSPSSSQRTVEDGSQLQGASRGNRESQFGSFILSQSPGLAEPVVNSVYSASEDEEEDKEQECEQNMSASPSKRLNTNTQLPSLPSISKTRNPDNTEEGPSTTFDIESQSLYHINTDSQGNISNASPKSIDSGNFMFPKRYFAEGIDAGRQSKRAKLNEETKKRHGGHNAEMGYAATDIHDERLGCLESKSKSTETKNDIKQHYNTDSATLSCDVSNNRASTSKEENDTKIHLSEQEKLMPLDNTSPDKGFKLHRSKSLKSGDTSGTMKNHSVKMSVHSGMERLSSQTSKILEYRQLGSRLGLSPSMMVSSPYHETSYMLSNSPYRSPFFEGSQSPLSVNRISSNASENLPSTSGPNLSHTASSIHARKRPHTSTRRRPDGSQVSERHRKIMKTTESNILILLSRLSVKTDPKHLVDISVVTTLLGYLSTAQSPIQRGGRILLRVCGNPLCFERLMLLQAPVWIAQCLLLQEDGLMSSTLFQEEWTDRYGTIRRGYMSFEKFMNHSSTETGSSQSSDFGKKMDFEFGGDAYSRMLSPSRAGSLFRGNPSLSEDSQTARDGTGASQDHPLSALGQAEYKVRLGLELLSKLSATCVSAFGQGELEHLLTTGSPQEQLACVVSLLYMALPRDATSRRRLLSKFHLWDLAVPCLFEPVAPLARRSILVALSFTLHLEQPPKALNKPRHLPPCPDVGTCSPTNNVPQTSHSSCIPGLDQSHLSSSSTFSKKYPSINKEPLTSISKGTLQELSRGHQRLITHKQQNVFEDCTPNAKSVCRYQHKGEHQNFCLVIEKNASEQRRFYVDRELLGRKSHVFGAMLSGTYTEANQSEVVIADVNEAGLEFVLHYMHGCASGCPIIDSVSLSALQEVRQGVKDLVSTLHTDNAGPSSIETDSISNADGRLSLLSTSEATGVNEKKKKETTYDSMSTTVSGTSSLLNEENGNSSSQKSLSQDLTKSFHTSASDGSSEKCTKIEDVCTGSQNSECSLFSQDQRSSSENDCDSKETECVETALAQLEQVVDKCADILSVADQFLFPELTSYISSVLSLTCLHPHTCKAIFHLACFYKLDSLALDCARETMLSTLLPSEVVSLYDELCDHGFRQYAMQTLAALLHSVLVM